MCNRMTIDDGRRPLWRLCRLRRALSSVRAVTRIVTRHYYEGQIFGRKVLFSLVSPSGFEPETY
jgi:hypothetical protein